MNVWRLTAQVATAQAGVMATWQLMELGVPDATFRERAARDGWEQLHRGVWALPATAATAERRLMAAVLAVGRPRPAHRELLRGWAADLARGETVDVEAAVAARRPPVDGVKVTGPWAALLHGLVERQPDLPPGLLVPSDRCVTAPCGVELHTTTQFGRTTHRVIGLVPVTGVNWTLTDLGRWWTEEQVSRTVATAVRLRRTSVASVGREVQRRGRYPGCGVARAVVAALRGELVHSGAERFARAALRELGLTPGPAPLDLVYNGRVLAQADIPFQPQCLDVEVDGPHHLLPEQATRDRKRDRDVRSLLSWHTVRFLVYEVLRDPRGFALEVRDTLRSLG